MADDRGRSPRDLSPRGTPRDGRRDVSPRGIQCKRGWSDRDEIKAAISDRSMDEGQFESAESIRQRESSESMGKSRSKRTSKRISSWGKQNSAGKSMYFVPEHLRDSVTEDSGARREGRRGGVERSLRMRNSYGIVHDTTGWVGWSRFEVGRVVESQHFSFFIGAVIVANTASIGLEQTARLSDWDIGPWMMLESIYLALYSVELGMRFWAYSYHCLADNWVRFDLLLVVMGILTSLMDQVAEQFGIIMVLRTIRPLRLMRAVRLLAKFKELWMLVQCVLNSASTMIYTMLLLLLVLYVAACTALEFITLNNPMNTPSNPLYDPEFAALVEEYFSNLAISMLTIVQFVCMDSISGIYKPFLRKDPMLIIFFGITILAVSIVLMNLVTAVVVNSALDQAAQDKDTIRLQENDRRQRLLRELRRMFIMLDEDGSGELSIEEIQNVTEEDQQLLCEAMTVGDPIEVFQALDVDGSGTIGIDEFCDGIWKVSMSKAPIEIKRIEKQVDQMHAQMKELTSEAIAEAMRKLKLEDAQAVARAENRAAKKDGKSCASTSKAYDEQDLVARVCTAVKGALKDELQMLMRLPQIDEGDKRSAPRVQFNSSGSAQEPKLQEEPFAADDKSTAMEMSSKAMDGDLARSLLRSLHNLQEELQSKSLAAVSTPVKSTHLSVLEEKFQQESTLLRVCVSGSEVWNEDPPPSSFWPNSTSPVSGVRACSSEGMPSSLRPRLLLPQGPAETKTASARHALYPD